MTFTHAERRASHAARRSLPSCWAYYAQQARHSAAWWRRYWSPRQVAARRRAAVRAARRYKAEQRRWQKIVASIQAYDRSRGYVYASHSTSAKSKTTKTKCRYVPEAEWKKLEAAARARRTATRAAQRAACKKAMGAVSASKATSASKSAKASTATRATRAKSGRTSC